MIGAAATLAVIGLGYVGLPLAVAFGRQRPVIGFDIKQSRIAELNAGTDSTGEIQEPELQAAQHLRLTSRAEDLRDASVFIVTVPTPLDGQKRPDLSLLEAASETVGQVLKRGDIVVYESTVYPGVTEEICVPILVRASGLTFNSDFYCGYSPERINPGDKAHRLEDICKVTSGSTPEAARAVDALYASIIPAGTYLAPSIRVAEAAKVIENTQRDLNIALVNELAIIFNRMQIDTEEVLRAAGTKWNFLPFRPGLVGGHCIGIDPYYLTHKAQAIGYDPQVILAGRRINDGMGRHVAGQLTSALTDRGIAPEGAKALILGLAFKENCRDLRNTGVAGVIDGLRDAGMSVHVHDPEVDREEALTVYGITPIPVPGIGTYDAIILAVAHDKFSAMGATAIRKFGRKPHVFYDLKHVFSASESDLRL